MEPSNQVEIQLGHLCNNRCVFCVSGQLTAQGRARSMAPDPVFRELDAARARGATKVTLLGGEPTLQKSFASIAAHAKSLGFQEIVIFTNGVMTSRPDFLERILALGDFTWRFSVQGATEQAHDRVTGRAGSFARIIASIRALRSRGQHVTANMCITTDNLSSLPHYPALVLEHGITQLHLDQIRPADAGERDDDYLHAIMPRYADQVPFLDAMLRGFGPTADVNVGNFPYCLLLEHAHHIHHDGQLTWTVAATERGLTEAFDKYATKRLSKSHPPACKDCIFLSRCSGLSLSYQRIFGADEVRAITPEALWNTDGGRRHLPLLLEPGISALIDTPGPAGWRVVEAAPDERAGTWRIGLAPERGSGRVRLAVMPPDADVPALGRADGFTLVEESGLEVAPAAVAALAQWVLEVLSASSGRTISQPVDTGAVVARAAGLSRAALRMARLLRAAPTPGWSRVHVGRTPRGFAARVEAESGGAVQLELRVSALGQLQVAYEVEEGTALTSARERLHAMASTLSKTTNTAL